jgi:hypothetical protein
MWFDPRSFEFMLLDGTCVFVTNPDKFDTKVMLDTGTQRIAAFGIELTWDPLVMSVNTSLGNNGVDPGPDPLNLTVNASNLGSLRIAGYDINGKGPSTAFHLVTVHWLANTPGTTAIDIKIETLADQNATSITAFPASGTVTVTPSLIGDVNGSESVDIVDALLVAQYYVGLTTSSFNSCFADVNRSGSIDIIDALRIAQCYVGLSSCSF